MITVYSKTHCPDCAHTKRYLQSRDIHYREINIEQDAAAREFILAQGHRTVPQIYHGDHVLVQGGWPELSKLSAEEISRRMRSTTLDHLGTL